jgi:beta-D-xylosidase 4
MLLLGVAAPLSAPPPGIPRACVPPHDAYPFCNAKLPKEQRVDDLISRLTLEEKPYLLVARESPKGNISRLGIPEYDWGGNCIHGVESRCAPDGRCPTSWPNPNALGATFNKTVWRSMGSAMGLELRSLWLQGVGENHDSNLPHIGLDCWSPNINLVRDPRWGRNLETPSEDPGVCGTFGSEVTQGLQVGSDKLHSDPRFLQAVVTLKHFDANSLEGSWSADGSPHGPLNRHTVDVNISQHDLFASYLPAFKQAVVEGDAKGVMCSYNSINGYPSCANPWLLQDTLRKAWGFKGYVTSDSGAVVDVFKEHHFTANWTQTVAAALNAGCDVESAPWGKDGAWRTGGPYIDYAPAAVSEGLMKEDTIDAALRNAVGLRFELGLFDPIEDQPYWHVPPEVVASKEHTALAVDATRQGFVLLQNGEVGAAEAAATTPVLPFKAGAKVAVIGPHANDRSSILGNYLGQICPDSIQSRACVTSTYEAIRDRNGRGPGATVNATGVGVNDTDTSGIAAAMAVAQASDTIVYVGGLDVTHVEREGQDRYDVGFPGLQPKLLTQLLALGKPLALVLFHGGMVTFPPDLLAAKNLAVVSAGYPGVHGAKAIAEALFDAEDGEPAVNRWGKTAVTWYSEGGWADAKFNMLDFDMAASPGRTHRYYTGTPQWPFGFGLSYSTFEVVKSAGARHTVRNTGRRTGDAVLFVYSSASRGTVPASAPSSSLLRTLVHFERIGAIAPGESRQVDFMLRPKHLTAVDERGESVFYPGSYALTLSVGNGAEEVEELYECTKARCDLRA